MTENAKMAANMFITVVVEGITEIMDDTGARVIFAKPG